MDEVPDRFRKNTGIAAGNKDHVDRHTENLNNEDVSEDKRILSLEDNKFSALQNLSKADFQKVIKFSLKSATEAAITAMQNVSSSQVTPIASSKTVTPFNHHGIVFKVADKISGDEIPRQEIPDCIWKLVQAKVPLTLPCITTTSIWYIHNNSTSIKTTQSTDGVLQSKDLMLNMSTFCTPEDISV
jgi:hypothetical protein